VQNAGIRIVHSLAVFEARDSLDDQRPAVPIDTDDPAYDGVAMAMGTRRRQANQTSM
jgi:hypothetical protein